MSAVQQPAERGESEHEAAAMRAYSSWSGNHPTIHCNRFPAWHELTEGERAIWRKKAALTAPPAAPQAGGEWVMVHKSWEPVMAEIYRRADKEGCLDGGCDFTVCIEHADYAAIAAAPQPPAAQAGEALERACAAFACHDGIDWHSAEWQATHKIEAGRLRARIASALAESTPPTDSAARTRNIGVGVDVSEGVAHVTVVEREGALDTVIYSEAHPLNDTDSAAREAAVAELIAAAANAEVGFNTMCRCYERNPGRFMDAMCMLDEDVQRLRNALAALQPSAAKEPT